ncbi:DUF2461 domain-containing protein [Roseivirga misakiensis]|uniref:TIGR02453 family protein n=1 Tax=Roseivirga misakiensis TaxID=1563681 RepID=A0A1E5T1G5_9BACT|nr:DUF2461 domain-containing protein [Roseivirga misakiensis]OEK05147.1 hypothetical protein BFP71_17195 [Roseivirga misakiensis]
MARKDIFKFLEALNENNSKEWMDKNRSWYESAKGEVIDLFDPILESIKEVDPRIIQPNARKSISRINNNLMFHPDRPTYKDHFGVVFGYGRGLADFYVGLGLREIDVAGGLWHPDSEKLKKVRQEIDYEGKRLTEIIKSSAFQDTFELYKADALKTTPKGYAKDHEFIELLRLKSLAAFRQITRKDVYSNGFKDMIVESYMTLVPMLDFINTAITDE